jgi:hypothetical protein
MGNETNRLVNDHQLAALIKQSDYFLQTRNQLDEILSIIIFIFGLCGNLLIIILMRRKIISKLTISVYLTSLAISDTFVLIFDNLINWIDLLSLEFSIKTLTDCKIYSIYYISKLISSWIIVSISIDRFLLVYFSTKTKKYLTKNHCILRVLLIIIVSIAVNLHLAILKRAPDNKDYHCISIDVYGTEYWNERVWPVIETLIYSLIPSILLTVLNVLIIIKSRKVKSTFWTKKQVTNNNSDYITKKINITVFAICFTFICLTLPANIHNICNINELALVNEYEMAYSSSKTDTDIDPLSYEKARVRLLEDLLIDRILDHMVNLYHAINFILYILTSDLFRQEFYLMFKIKFRDIFERRKKNSFLVKNKISPIISS